MTKEEEKNLRLFETRVRQLILEYKDLETENQKLHAIVKEQEEALKGCHKEIERLQTEYSNLKTAKIIDISSGELEEAKNRVNKLIKEVDKCISLLNV
ncbi:hypothetical protein EVA_11019 [gut metagenome]|uniref:Uncharacterized protein n=1 Tax=gut metagenome TaxID=749906 RepID=J9CLA2_9ZZZZ